MTDVEALYIEGSWRRRRCNARVVGGGGDDARMRDIRHGLDVEKQGLAVREGGVG
jgi:hypothetical protein